MSSQKLSFKELHHQNEPLLIANAWNAQSVRMFEKLNFKAIATSSAAVAESLGYNDGEEMSFEEYWFVVRHMRTATTLPMSVDLESGYSKTPVVIAKTIAQLATIGINGINIEDSVMDGRKRIHLPAEEFAEKLEAVVNELKRLKIEMFINARCDTFLLGLPNALEETRTRAKLYEEAGADGLFLPCITKLNDIQSAVKLTNLPLNVMAMPGLPSFNALRDAGVKRISMGNFLNKHAYTAVEKITTQILADDNFESLFK